MAMGSQINQAMNAPASNNVASAPPPIPGAVSFFAVVDGKQAGPFDHGQLQDQVASGKVTRSTLVWQQGMGQWTAAEKVPALSQLFANVPPPIPQG